MIRIIGNLRSMVLHMGADIQLYVSDLVRQLFRQELEHRLVRETIKEAGTSGARFLQLEFENELPATIFTFSKIKEPIKIALYDIRSQSIVTDGVYSSTKIEVCVLNGEFGSNSNDQDWNAKDFKARIIRQRVNKEKLLKGDTVITLEKGVGYITNIMITDISRCTRGGRFRLGVKSILNQANIREGRSEPFVVKHIRGELNQKHYPPSPNDDIWRLTKVAKDGKLCQRLSWHGINTVKDLLQLHETDPSSLPEKFGKTSKRQREAIIDHAKTCVEVTSDGQNNHRPKSNSVLNSDEKLMEREKQHTYRNVNDLIPVDDISSVLMNLPPSPLASVVPSAGHCGAPDLQGLDLPTIQQSQLETWPYLSQASNIGESNYQLPELEGMPLYRSELGGEFVSGECIEGNGWPLINGSQIQSASYFSAPTPWDHINDHSFCLPYGNGPETSKNHSSFTISAVNASRKGKRRTVWHKIRSALKWVILHAAKRKAKLFRRHYN